MYLFFFTIPRPPRSTLFPYRRSSDLPGGHSRLDPRCREVRLPARLQRSEEHTSELQSPDHLVCRLLLEKKNADNAIFQGALDPVPPNDPGRQREVLTTDSLNPAIGPL